jgi:predicted dehydrogenase
MPQGTDPATEPFPRSIAIAGAWGYIGRKFLDVALRRGLTTYVFDPGPLPRDVDPSRLTRIESVEEFSRLNAEVFHLAVHPEHRRADLLLARPDAPLILNEKPMAEPARPDQCRAIVEAAAASSAVMLFDFPELFDPLTARVLDRLSGYRDLTITGLELQRSKDREDPSNRRNDKRMVPIQYQETVHCLAFALYVLAAVGGGTEAVLGRGVTLRGESDPYVPPNPEAYPYVVDGRCRYRATLGGVDVEGLTDFKRNAAWAKRRVIRGVGDGRPFVIEASYLEGAKSLTFDGVAQPCDPKADSYEHVLATLARWSRRYGRGDLMAGLFPNPALTRLTYQLSSALWRSCRDGRDVAFGSAGDLLAWDARFADEVSRLPRYDTR